jgi:hypothetical protein
MHVLELGMPIVGHEDVTTSYFVFHLTKELCLTKKNYYGLGKQVSCLDRPNGLDCMYVFFLLEGDFLCAIA